MFLGNPYFFDSYDGQHQWVAFGRGTVLMQFCVWVLVLDLNLTMPMNEMSNLVASEMWDGVDL